MLPQKPRRYIKNDTYYINNPVHRTMWQCVRSIYNNHIKIHPDLYISCDDIIAIHDLIYEITGISDDYDVYIKDNNNQQHIYPAPAFVQMLESSDFKYIRNMHQECIEKNKLYCTY